MKISTRTEYGIRILVTLARIDPDDTCLSLTQIAKVEKLPHAYLEQLVGDLRRAGLVTATRGQAGGYRLARPAAEIADDRRRSRARGPAPRDAVRRCRGPGALRPAAAMQRARGLPARLRVAQRLPRRHDLAEVAATAGGPPYPPEVRRRRIALHSAMTARTTQEARNA